MQRISVGKSLKYHRSKLEEALRCDACGFQPPPYLATSILEAHHIEPAADGGPHAYENLILLCANCHRAAHKLFPRQRGYRVVPTRDLLLEALADPEAFLEKKQAHIQKIVEDIHPYKAPPSPPPEPPPDLGPSDAQLLAIVDEIAHIIDRMEKREERKEQAFWKFVHKIKREVAIVRCPFLDPKDMVDSQQPSART